MLKSNLSCIILMFFGVITTSCDQHELEEAVTESTAVVENAASAPVLIEESFEGISPLSLFHGKEFGTAHAFRLSANPVFAGKKVARVELRATAARVIPGLPLPIHALAESPVERFRADTGGFGISEGPPGRNSRAVTA